MVEENKKTVNEERKEEKKLEETKKEEKKEEKALEFTIPLGKKFRKTVRYKKTPKAIKAIKEFLLRHMKVYDGDLKKIKLDKYLNEFMWSRGIRNPPSKIKVKVVRDGEMIRAELAELPENLRWKKEKMEKRETKPVLNKKKESEKTEVQEKTEEEKKEEKEKKSAVVEAGQKIEKATAKQAKHMGKEKPMQPKRQRRMALQK